jgi:hypothetical protein
LGKAGTAQSRLKTLQKQKQATTNHQIDLSQKRKAKELEFQLPILPTWI